MYLARRRPTVPARAAIAGVLCLAACAPSGVGRIAPLFVPPPFPEFARQPDTRPAISSGRAGLPLVAFDPGVLVDEEGQHLFFTAIFCRRENAYSYSWDPDHPAACDIERSVGSIAYAFSADEGLTWQFRQSPVIVPSDSGFDSAKIETASVFRRGETLFMAYSADGHRGGRKLTSRYQIGLATLALGRRSVRTAMMDDATRFERRPTPLLPYDVRPGRFDNNVQEPSVVVGPEGIFLYYIGLGLGLPEESVDAPGQQITSIGLGRAVLDPNLNVISRSSSALITNVNMPEVHYFAGAYHLFAADMGSGDFHRGETLTYSTSLDGQRWSSPVPLLKGSVSGLDEWGMMAPTVAMAPDHLVLFYTAYTTEARACFPIPAGGRFGRPVAGGSQCLFATVGRAVSARPGGAPGRND